MTGKFGTAINCIDGRVQTPVAEWVKREYGVDFVDMITAPGAVKEVGFAGGALQISIDKHRSKVVAVAGHWDCAGNPVSDEEHKEMIKNAVEKVKSWGLDIEVVGVWVDGEGVVTKLGD